MSKRECRKCGEVIPNRVKIDGVSKNLRNRKFCLKCSPYRGGNNKSDDPSRPTKKRTYANWSDETKKRARGNIYKRGLERKIKLVRLAGGRCKECGYNKNIKALVFHHKDSSQKEFGLSMNNLWSKSWEIILKEFEKCDMYCHNCHTELHDEISKNDPNHYSNVFNFDDSLPLHKDKINKVYKYVCQICGKEFESDKNRLKFCSDECRKKHRENLGNKRYSHKDRPSKEELEELLQNNSYGKIGKMFGVSDNTIKKWAKKLDIDISIRSSYFDKKLINCQNCQKEFIPESRSKFCSEECKKQYMEALWDEKYRKLPTLTKEELENLIRANSYIDLAKRFDVCDMTIRKWAKKLGIDKRMINKNKSRETKVVS